MARKKGMQFIPYDYEAAYNKSLEDMHEWFIENLFQHRKKVVYALKEITAGDQFEIEIYPRFRSMDEVPPEGRTIKKDNNKAQKNLNDKNARKYVERLINENFSDRDIWMTLTYDDAHLPPDGDVDAAIKNVQKYIRRINYQRKKRGLPNAKYVYVTAYNPDAEIRWHHHIVMDGALDMETGLLLINGVYHVKAVPPYNSTGAGYTNTGLTPSGTSGGYCSRMEMASDIGRIPTVASGSETTYECDGVWFNNTIVAVALFGGRRGGGSKCGLSCWGVDNPATSVYTNFVASLSCKPPVAAA